RTQLDTFRAAQTAAAEAMTLPPPDPLPPGASAAAVSPFSPQGGGAL
ncbi:MAG: 5-(carboxyamino)imidazole ribonucleotide mutase, partial [Comamonadaceae bacterium]